MTYNDTKTSIEETCKEIKCREIKTNFRAPIALTFINIHTVLPDLCGCPSVICMISRNERTNQPMKKET